MKYAIRIISRLGFSIGWSLIILFLLSTPGLQRKLGPDASWAIGSVKRVSKRAKSAQSRSGRSAMSLPKNFIRNRRTIATARPAFAVSRNQSRSRASEDLSRPSGLLCNSFESAGAAT